MVPVLQKQEEKREKRRRERAGDRPGVGNGGSPVPGDGEGPRSPQEARKSRPAADSGPHRAGAAEPPRHGRAPGSGGGRAAGLAALPVPGHGAPALPVPWDRPLGASLRADAALVPRYPTPALPVLRVSPVAVAGAPEQPVRLGQGVPGLRTRLQAQTGPGSFPGFSRPSFALSQPGPSGAPPGLHFRFNTISPTSALIYEAKGSAAGAMGTRWDPAKPPRGTGRKKKSREVPGNQSGNTGRVPAAALTCSIGGGMLPSHGCFPRFLGVLSMPPSLR